MYCINCGNKITENNQFCPSCGHKINETTKSQVEPIVNKPDDSKRTASIVLGILSLVGVVFFVFAPIAFILGIIGLILAIKANKTVKNPAGIILNAIGVFLSFVIVSIMALIILFSYNIIKNGPDYSDIINNYIEQYSSNSDSF